MKKFIFAIGFFLLVAYLVFSIFYFKDKPKEFLCNNMEVVVNNGKDGVHFIDTTEIVKSINGKGLNPIGKQIKDINTSELEEMIHTSPLVRDVRAYVTDNGTVKINIDERKPILRIISNTGENYYIDSEGERMPLSKNFTAYLPIATGAIKEDFAKGDLYKFALFLCEDEFWGSQIEQIVVTYNNEVEFTPRVGNQQIVLGKLDEYKEKLEKLLLFYKEEQNVIGWNKYSVINLKYDKQVVCTKR